MKDLLLSRGGFLVGKNRRKVWFGGQKEKKSVADGTFLPFVGRFGGKGIED